MSLIGITTLPCILMALTFLLAIKNAYQSRSPARLFILYPLIFSFLVTSGFMLWAYHATLTSKSSTAAIGFFLIPFYSLAIAVVGFLLSWACYYVVHFIIQRVEGTRKRQAANHGEQGET